MNLSAVPFAREIVPLGGEFSRCYSPLGLRLIDTVSGRPPFGRLDTAVDVSDGQGDWRELSAAPIIITPSSIVAMPGFGRTVNASDASEQLCRFRLKAQYYHPVYPPPTVHPTLIPPPAAPSTEAYEFVVFPWNDEHEPDTIISGPAELNLYPAPNYPFSRELEVLHGRVTDQNGTPLFRAEADASPRQAYTDRKGWFALGLPRFSRQNLPVQFNLNISHRDSNHNWASVFQVEYPTDFQQSRTFKLP